MARQQEEIAGFRFRLGAVLAVRFCLQWFFVWTMIWATAAILLRVFLRGSADAALGGAGLRAGGRRGAAGGQTMAPDGSRHAPCWTGMARWAGW